MRQIFIEGLQCCSFCSGLGSGEPAIKQKRKKEKAKEGCEKRVYGIYTPK
jgi:hypothetical protein